MHERQTYSEAASVATAIPEDAVAIVGMACRLPGAPDVATFWDNLCAGRESITHFSEDELLKLGVPASLLADPHYVKAGAVLPDVDAFDADFFGFSPREAALTDPQHRVFMECAWEALEDAGHVPDPQRRVGVFAGVGLNTYLLTNVLAHPEIVSAAGTLPLAIANKADFMPSKLSYRLGLTGPSVNVNTACSTSLVAVHTACQSLLNHECDLALAGGVTLDLSTERGYMYQSGGVSSSDGHCRAFDAKADGTVCGSGVGAVLLMRLDEAVEDGYPVYAVIRGSAINNDGAAKVGYTAPSIQGQREVIATALAVADVDPATVGYVEAHGTGTVLGDPIEVRALTEAFRMNTERVAYCALGSVKPNVGHLDTAAGVASLIKTALCVHKAELVPNINYEQPNPAIDFAASPFYVNTEHRPWPKSDDRPRRAGVSSFGIGGTNAHIVLEEPPPLQPAQSVDSPGWQVLPLSAEHEGALGRMCERLATRLEQFSVPAFGDIAYTLQAGRKAFRHRLAVACRDHAEAVYALREQGTHVIRGMPAAGSPSIAFLLPGIGDQYVGMGEDLYSEQPLFRSIIDECAAELEPLIGVDLRTLLYPPESARRQAAPAGLDLRAMLGRSGSEDPAEARLRQTRFAHPALFAIAYATARLLMSWGIMPKALIGHSLGQYAAACLAGVMSLPDALRVVAMRARIIDELPVGQMLAVALPEDTVRAEMPAGLSLAAVNAAEAVVVAGPPSLVDEYRKTLTERGVAHLAVASSHAFHSSMLESARPALSELLHSVPLAAPTIPCLSNVSGTWMTAEEATSPTYWVDHSLATVRFADGVGQLLASGHGIFVEVGPGQTLSTFVQQHAPATGGAQACIAALPGPHERGSACGSAMRALAALWCLGATPDWAVLHAGQKRRRVPLPTYPFERQRHWLDSAAAPAFAAPPRAAAVVDLPYATGGNSQPTIQESAPNSPATRTRGLRPQYEAPTTDFEATIAEIWEDLFGIRPVGRDDSFFVLGGSSLLAVQFISRLRGLYHVDFPLAALFRAPTVAQVASAVEALLLAEIENMDDEEAERQLLGEDAPTCHAALLELSPVDHTLPNGRIVRQFNRAETEHFFSDIFEQRVYCRNGIRLRDGAVVFDVGANIGLFSLFASLECKAPRIFAFEPAPPVFAALQYNVGRHGIDAVAMNCGVGNETGRRTLTFYPLSTGMSSFHASKAEEKDVLRAIMVNQWKRGEEGMGDVMTHVEEILEQRFVGTDFECEMVTLSQIIDRHGIERIDLIKIDVQKSEFEVLEGIAPHHWPRICQMVIEVHDFDGRVQRVANLLQSHGFQVTVEQELLYEASNISIVYGIRKETMV